MSYTYTQDTMALDFEGGEERDAEGDPSTKDRRGLESRFDPAFVSPLALREKQIQQNYRPVIGVHKWFARRPGTLFRSLLLSEFVDKPLQESFWRAHDLRGVIADPFMGGGTPIFEANRLGFAVVGTDINPMAYWIVRQALDHVDIDALSAVAEQVAAEVELELGRLYRTRCIGCGEYAPVKYFLWVKVESCPQCGIENDLFPGYLLAQAKRHPNNVILCHACGELNEFDQQPSRDEPQPCVACGSPVFVEGPARRGRIRCRGCEGEFRFPSKSAKPPRHRMWAIEYHCSTCRNGHDGRFFKRPDSEDLACFEEACILLEHAAGLPIPDDEIPAGDETDRLHRWGYKLYREMFNGRQLLGLGVLLRRLLVVPQTEVRHALLTVFSDFLRYQNMLCRYDTYALKCQDIFSVHGFPVGLLQCENNILGIPRVGSGSFRHFVAKYIRAKRFCIAPFETRQCGSRKTIVVIDGEKIEAEFVDGFPWSGKRQAKLLAATATGMSLPPASLDGVFTDPPYYDNVQYAELMDFCFAWLRLGLQDVMPQFRRSTTRSQGELTGNSTLGRGLEHFTAGLSAIFRHYAAALKPRAPFVFTYHHNDPSAYVPLVVAILDAGLDCTATLPAVAEMTASLHINGTGSSILDSVFVCRAVEDWQATVSLDEALRNDANQMLESGLRLSAGDLRCLAAGHVARVAVNRLSSTWNCQASLADRMTQASECIRLVSHEFDADMLVQRLVSDQPVSPE